MNHTITTPLPFLGHVAQDILNKHGEDLSGLTIVFPNKRASLFINEQLALLAGKPIWSPSYTTISELFHQRSKRTVADDIKLICDLYRSYVECTGSTETLDQFYGWGSVLLSDFDDIDKSMAQAQSVFSNLSDLHSFDHADYLSEEQIQVLQFFFKGFDENHNSRLKEKFLHLWSKFGHIYTNYNQRLSDQGLAYEGALCREVVENEDLDWGDDTYIFIGFNALQEVERRLFKKLKKAGQAEFYWDFDHYYMTPDNLGKPHEAGAQIRKLMADFPNQLDSNDDAIYRRFEQPKDITFIGAPTESAQARYVGEWLQDPKRVEAGNRSAVVMCQENLLPTIIHCIPSHVKQLNITTGYPLNQTAAASLVNQLIELAMYGQAGTGKYRQKYVISVLRHPYSCYISPEATELCSKIVAAHHYFPSRDELTVDEGTELLFKDLSSIHPQEGGQEYDRNLVVNQWLLDLIRRVALAAHESEDKDPLTHETLFRTYTLVNRFHQLLESGDLKVDPITYQRLLQQIITSTTVPFHGEPAVGLQVMGVLETRNLDFDHLLILSCNEGNMPKSTDNPSFIPQSIREAFSLTTINQKTGIYAYYFLRMIQRAQDVTILYGNAADNKNTGEKSRFMLQMMVESGHDIKRLSLISSQLPSIRERYAVKKSPEIQERLNNMSFISPTAINRYQRCQLQFFFCYVAGIKEPDAEGDEIDNRVFGNIFHDASQFIYDEITGTDRSKIDEKHPFAGPGHTVEKSQIEYALKHPGLIERNLDRAFKKHLFNNEAMTYTPEYNGLQIINRKVILHYLRQLLQLDQQLAPFTIRGLEGDVYTTIKVTTSQGEQKKRIGGRIDRLDEVVNANGERRIRVLDYKTGSSMADVKTLEGVFDPTQDKHNDYYLQAMLYALIVSRDKEANPMQLPVSPALLFIQHASALDYNPILSFGNEEISDMRDYADDFMEKLTAVVAQILEPQQPFAPCDNPKTCATCPYAKLCGRLRMEG